jgi:NAD(P)-dependent dehydrogenase (short-subunit alcohol dehydrogenase family)
MTEHSSSTRLDGRVVLLTGAAGLLGRQYTRALVAAGARVALLDRDAAGVNELSRTAGGDSLPLAVDVTDGDAVRNAIDKVTRAFGRLDVLVNNAAIDPKFDQGALSDRQVTFEDFPIQAWNEALAVNVTGMFLCAQAVAKPMLAQGGGVIVNVSSMYGMVGPDQRLYEEPGGPAAYKPVTYSVTKSAVSGLTKYLATYWAGRNIRVNTLTLGGVEHQQSAGFLERYAARTPLGRMARPDEYCGALLFLASDASSYMTGANLVVDGGWTAW